MHEIMEFLLPIFAASAEAMIWVLMIVTLIVIGRGKMLPSEQSLVIERNGQYRMDLAPGLNLAQPFIEAIASQVTLREDTNHNGLILCFEVRDKNLSSRKQPFYVLKVSSQNGYLSFDAKLTSQESILHNTTSSAYDGRTMMHDIENAIHAVAKLWGIGVQRIN